MKNPSLAVALALAVSACFGGGAYQVYEGEPRPLPEVAVVDGAQFLRQDWLNRYVDAVRFARVDGVPIENSSLHSRVEVEPGVRDFTVYFSWDMGSARGLTAALIDFATTRETVSRTLRFEVRSGRRYIVRAQPVFGDGREDIITLRHVDFWVEDSEGNEILSREAGRYVPERDG